MTVRDFERERLNKAGIKPIPFANDDFAACGGKFILSRNQTAGLCYLCKRYGHRSRTHVEPVAQFNGERWDCENFRALVTAAQVEAVDETHVGNVPHQDKGAVSRKSQTVDNATTLKGGE